MHGEILDNASLTIALALATGVLSQILAQHIRIPGIVLLLAAGVVLGPEVLDVVRPATLGHGLHTLVGFAVAIILFEGGLNLNIRRLRKESTSIQHLITIGGLVTLVGATLAARVFLMWSWRMSILFGTLVIVTGPTVITPLLKRIKVERSVSVVLEAEGVLIDAIGAIAAVMALEVALQPSGSNIVKGAINFATHLGLGAWVGAAGGLIIGAALRYKAVIPDGLKNIFTLSMTLAIFQVSNALLEESGIAAVTVAGFIVGNMPTHGRDHLVEFKEQLTSLVIGMLFVLLAAGVRLSDVESLGIQGLFVVLTLMLVVRPANIFASTTRSEFSTKQKLFMSWIGPRGIVAAAVASLFAASLESQGIPGGRQLQALVFLVIAITVLTAGLTGGPLAKVLGLKRKSDSGWVLLGAHELARALAQLFKDNDQEAVLIDSDPNACAEAEKQGLRVIYGNALTASVLGRAHIDSRRGIIAIAPRERLNLLFLQKADELAKLKNRLIAIGQVDQGVTGDMVVGGGGQLLPLRSIDIEAWSKQLRLEKASVERWTLEKRGEEDDSPSVLLDVQGSKKTAVALTVERKGVVSPARKDTKFAAGDTVGVLVNHERSAQIAEKLESLGWRRADSVSSE